MELSTYVYNERKKRYMTQDNLSKLTGISMSEVCRIERGTRNNPSLSALRAIAKAFGKTTAELVRKLDDDDSQCEEAKTYTVHQEAHDPVAEDSEGRKFLDLRDLTESQIRILAIQAEKMREQSGRIP